MTHIRDKECPKCKKLILRESPFCRNCSRIGKKLGQHSKEWNKKISEGNKGKNKGRRHTDETKRKISESHSGKPHLVKKKKFCSLCGVEKVLRRNEVCITCKLKSKTKKCSWCKAVKIKSDFPLSKHSNDGKHHWCKECSNQKSLIWKRKNKKRMLETGKKWRKDNPLRHYKNTLNYKKRYPQKARAQSIVALAIKSGSLIKQPCEICGIENDVHAHHPDYQKPLIVEWLCPQHHSWRHLNRC